MYTYAWRFENGAHEMRVLKIIRRQYYPKDILIADTMRRHLLTVCQQGNLMKDDECRIWGGGVHNTLGEIGSQYEKILSDFTMRKKRYKNKTFSTVWPIKRHSGRLE